MKRRKRKLGRPSRCLCGGPKIYALCCKPYHQGDIPETPVKLMKSRFTAYAMDLTDYIMQTTLPDSPAWEDDVDAWRESIQTFSRDFDFVRVEILDDAVDESADTGMVTFRAVLKAGDEDASFTETSRFVREDGRWLYASGSVDA